ncbi:MAG: ComEC family competence protein, partial [Dehalococcoidia bacterium]
MNLEDLQPGIPPPERPKPLAPLLPLALGIILGIVADSFLTVPTSGALAIVVAGAVLVLSMNRRPLSKSPFGLHGSVGFIAVLVSAAGVGSLRHAIADRWLAEDHVLFFTDNQPILAELHGRILTPPRILEPRPDVPRAYPVGPKTRFVLEATYIAGDDGPIHVSGKVAVVVKGAALSLRAGDLVEMTGWVYRPPGPSNPGAYDWARHQRRRGLRVGMSCEHAESVIVRRAGNAGTWPGIVQRVRSRLRGYLLNDAFEAGDPGAGVMAAMVLGERSAVSQAMNEAFIKTGNAHFLAASGMHVGWLGLIGWGICRLLGLYYRTAAIAVGLLILTYVLLAEPRPSIMRAGIIGLLACITIYIRGHYNSLNSLSLAAVLVLMFDPMDLFRPAFQYSFMAVLALLHLCPHVAKTIAAYFMRINL